MVQTNCPHLEKLNFISNQIGLDGCEELGKIGALKHLKSLRLDNCEISDEACMHLGNLSNLTTLGLYRNSIGDEGCKFLSNGNLPKLKRLFLSHNKIGNEGCKHLGMNSKNLPELEELTLLHNTINDEGCKYLSELSNLTSLSVGDDCSNDSCMYFTKKLHRLKRVNMSTSTKIDGSGFTRLMTQLSQLTSLDLSKSKVNDDDIASIHLDYFKKIETLKLRYCTHITDQTSQYLIEHAQYFTNLKVLYASEISNEQKMTLRSKFPDLYFDHLPRRVYPFMYFNVHE
ncbi:hypothetical protein FDP41_013162 [Naegleria fowleri]|uniref:Uncharacterized protein n=1 Tax=Naegleria fowleri TaxID=5763 RepID=A0A6A5C5U2_NAEFO|nr:uncharacterized protein FDP41_013162 [Naegleria fowleri]KAF0980679.1 hypothetical protein FDP41_013162 [Naegleria fowleri]